MSPNEESTVRRIEEEDLLTRRHLVQRAGIAAALMATPAVLSACGGSGSSTTAAAGSSQITPLGKQINRYVGPGGPKAGGGLDWNLGASLPLSGPGAFYGREMEHGIALAIDHILQAGGPQITATYEDNKTGDPNAGIQNVKELGVKGSAAMLSSYIADFGAQLPGIDAYKILTVDPGGGTGQGFLDQPFFWGSRASWPDAPFKGIYKYVSETMPDARRVSLLIWDNGASFVNPAKASLEEAIRPYGMELVSVETSPAGATDFSTTVARLKSASPDVIQVAMAGTDVSYFLKGKAAAGLEAQAIGSDWNPETEKVAGRAAAGFWFSFDYLDPAHPPNPWSKLYVDAYRKQYNAETTWLAANYYESTFVFWELIRRVLAKGGEIESGEQLEEALEEDPQFPSVYGGSSSKVGTMAFDPKTHTISTREMSLVDVDPNGSQKVLATYGIEGVDYRKVA